MFASEFGQDTWDELNIIEPGANYGWRKSRVSATTIASPIPYSNGRPPMPVPAASPSSETPSSSPISAVSVFGSCPLRPDTSSEFYVGEFGRLRDAVVTPDGDLWMVTSNTDRGAGSDDSILRVPLAAG